MLNKSIVFPFSQLLIGFIVGVAMTYLIIQPRLTYQGKTITDWAISTSKNQNEANSCKEQLSSISAQIKTQQPLSTSTTNSKNNLKTIKGMNCQKTGSDGSMDCQEYQYTYNPNSKTTTGTLPSDMLQTPLQPLP